MDRFTNTVIFKAADLPLAEENFIVVSLEDGTVTIRERDTMAQRRVAAAELRSIIDKEVNMNNLLRNL